jgi:hypothetical protein
MDMGVSDFFVDYALCTGYLSIKNVGLTLRPREDEWGEQSLTVPQWLGGEALQLGELPGIAPRDQAGLVDLK